MLTIEDFEHLSPKEYFLALGGEVFLLLTQDHYGEWIGKAVFNGVARYTSPYQTAKAALGALLGGGFPGKTVAFLLARTRDALAHEKQLAKLRGFAEKYAVTVCNENYPSTIALDWADAMCEELGVTT